MTQYEPRPDSAAGHSEDEDFVVVSSIPIEDMVKAERAAHVAELTALTAEIHLSTDRVSVNDSIARVGAALKELDEIERLLGLESGANGDPV